MTDWYWVVLRRTDSVGQDYMTWSAYDEVGYQGLIDELGLDRITSAHKGTKEQVDRISKIRDTRGTSVAWRHAEIDKVLVGMDKVK